MFQNDMNRIGPSTNPYMREYEAMYEKLLEGAISETEWKGFCGKLLEALINENKDTLKRLKEN